ncbi:MAG: dihydroneopterin aldolase [Cytophagales bacterium]|nr:dihydroneopterin aldolase [Cytophagales bacterium]
MNRVSLEGLEFFAYHGFYPEEQVLGTYFVLDIHIDTDFKKASESDDLSYTVDYEEVYQITKKEMAIPSKLLENVLYRIIERIKQQFEKAVQKITISIEKKNPPLGGVCNCSKITISE